MGRKSESKYDGNGQVKEEQPPQVQFMPKVIEYPVFSWALVKEDSGACRLLIDTAVGERLVLPFDVESAQKIGKQMWSGVEVANLGEMKEVVKAAEAVA